MIDDFAKSYLHIDLRDVRETMVWRLDDAGHADIFREQLDGAVGMEAGSRVQHGRDEAFWLEHCAHVEQAANPAPDSMRDQPRPAKGMPAAITVMNKTFDWGGRLAM